MSMGSQALIVLRAQLQMYRNVLGRRGTVATVFNFIATGTWYVFAVLLAWFAGSFFASLTDLRLMTRVLVVVLFGVAAYWQLSPIVTVSFGLALDLKRLLIFPIRPNQYFLIELLLCLPTSVEALLVTLGIVAGLVLNPLIPNWLVFATGSLFLSFNLFLNVALRALIAKVAVKRIWRELVLVFALALVIAPQFLLSAQSDERNWLERLTVFDAHNVFPWSAAASAFTGTATVAGVARSLGARGPGWRARPVFPFSACGAGFRARETEDGARQSRLRGSPGAACRNTRQAIPKVPLQPDRERVSHLYALSALSHRLHHGLHVRHHRFSAHGAECGWRRRLSLSQFPHRRDGLRDSADVGNGVLEYLRVGS